MRPQKLGSICLPALFCLGLGAGMSSCSRQASEPSSDPSAATPSSPSWISQILKSSVDKKPGSAARSPYQLIKPVDRKFHLVTPTLREGVAPHGPTLRAAMIQAVQAEADSRYAAVAAAPDTLRAENIDQQLTSTMGPRGAKVQARNGAETHDIGFRLTGFGCAKDGMDKVPSAKPQARGNRVEYARGDVVEWYQNGRLGLEQGFTLSTRPSCRTDAADDAVVLALDVELERAKHQTAQLMENRGEQWIEIRDSHGEVVLRYSDLYAEDATGKQLDAKMQLSGSKLTLRIDDRDAKYPLTVDPLIWAQVNSAYKQAAGDQQAGDNFGFSIAVSGDHAVVGAPNDAELAANAGAAYVFTLSAQGVWTQQLKIGSIVMGARFGYSVAIDDAGGGNKRIVVGAPKDIDVAAGVEGTASWYLGRSSTFSSDGSFGGIGEYGTSVAVSGTHVIAGGPTYLSGDGIVIIHKPEPTSTPPWNVEQAIEGAAGLGERFGAAVAVDGEVAVFGAPGANSSRGTAYVYEYDSASSTWKNRGAGGILTASDAAANDLFGSSVAISGLNIVVGAPAKNTSTGAAYAYVSMAGNWMETMRLQTAAGLTLAMGDKFGISVDISGSLIAVGASGTTTSAGAIYAFNSSGSTWALDATGTIKPKTPSANELFGSSVAIDGTATHILVGAPGNSTGGAFYDIIQRKKLGDACLAATECASDFCVDGVCCNNACGGGTDTDCQACSPGKKQSGASDGICDFAKSTQVCRASVDAICDPAEMCTGAAVTCPADAHAAAATVCRASAGGCDIQETCGGAATCPADTRQAVGFVCRAAAAGAAGACDQSELCDGTSAACPADVKAPKGTVCSPATGACDAQELCDGVTNACPTDAVLPNTAVCRTANGVCDKQEFCDGSTKACPADAFYVSADNIECRASAGVCDVKEICNGSGVNCPADTFLSAATVCRPAADAIYDTAENCTGTTAACPADAVASAGTVCRPAAAGAAGICDQAEVCNGKNGVCPGDVKKPAGTTCRAAGGVCDVPEFCDGATDTCPADVLIQAAANVECRASAGVCDVREICNGSGVNCPADTFVSAATVCRPAVDAICDTAENCTGSSAACPMDTVAAVGTVCRPVAAGDAGLCDQAELCNGKDGVCPGDLKKPAGLACRPASGICDVSEFCDGATNACPTDAVITAGSNTVCRASAGICDVDDVCDGTAKTCPTDVFKSNMVVCRPAVDAICDTDEKCTGTAAACPTDAVATAGTVCRNAAGNCDQSEVCNGKDGVCPGDIKKPAGVTCRAAAGICDVTEYCDGATDNCPANGFVAMGTECRASAGICDVAEACTGAAATCPMDAFMPNTTVCRALAGNCDVADTCTGSAAACPPDSVQAFGTMCRTSKGACDVAESCDGASGVCPGDSKVPNGVTCRSSAGICDVTETCDGVTDNCPVNGFVTAGTTCRPSTGSCDPMEACTGAAATCPADILQPAGFVCRASQGICDQTETCDGVLGDCPDDLKVPSGTICRPSQPGFCDPAELCDGRTNTCPNDQLAADGDLCPGGTCQVHVCRVEADLVVAAAAAPGYSGPTSVLGYTLGVGNIGRSPTTMVVLTLTVPHGTELITQRDDGSVGDGWTCRTKGETADGVEIECTRPTLGVGENTLVAVGLRPPAGLEKVDLSAHVSSAIFDPVLANNSATLTQSLLSERYAGGGIGCNAAPTRAPASPVGWLLALFGALTLTFRRRRSS